MTTDVSDQQLEPDGSGGHGDAAWDARYAESDRIWSGEPNGGLVLEAADLTPGRALDVGCGEGADAVWLARRGWSVTALDVSQVALDRARSHAAVAGVEITWVHDGMAEADLTPGGFDLVSAQYPAIPKTPDLAGAHALLAAVAPGGTLLVVHHSRVEGSATHGFKPEDFLGPADVEALLGDGWVIEVSEERERVAPPAGAGAHHAFDVVLRAKRVG